MLTACMMVYIQFFIFVCNSIELKLGYSKEIQIQQLFFTF